MSDDIVTRLRTCAGIDDVHDAADLIEAQAAEITRLRALCDRQSTALSLSGMRHGRILVGLERRNRRQRRALAKLYQRRHDKNAEITRLRAALATARRDALAEIKQDTDELIEQGRQDGMEYAAQIGDRHIEIGEVLSETEADKRLADNIKMQVGAMKQVVDAIRAAAKEGE